MQVVREEIFGPVLCVSRFSDDDEAVAQANASIYGLAASLFTRDLSRAHRVAQRLKAGTIGVNTHHVIDPALPFGDSNSPAGGVKWGGKPLNFIPSCVPSGSRCNEVQSWLPRHPFNRRGRVLRMRWR